MNNQQSYVRATEMGGVEVVKNVLLPNPKGSLKSKYSGNYEATQFTHTTSNEDLMNYITFE